MTTWLAVSLLAAAASAQEAKPVVKSCSEIDWKVSGSLPASGAAGHEYHLMHEQKGTGAVQTLVRFSRGYALPRHSHSSDETLLVLSGKLELELEGKTTVLKRGAYAVIPAGTPHAMTAKGFRGCRLMVSFSGPVDFKGLPSPK